MRNLNPAAVAASRADVFDNLIFVSLAFDATPTNPGGTLYVHNGIGIINTLGQDWYGVGDFGAISTIEESNAISPYQISLVLSGIDAIIIDEALNEDYYLRPVLVYLGFLDSKGLLVADPDEIWSGKMVKMTVALGNQNSVVLQCESDLADMDRAEGARFNDSDHQAQNPGDTFFRWQGEVERIKLQWGDNRNSVAYSGQTGGVSVRRTNRDG